MPDEQVQYEMNLYRDIVTISGPIEGTSYVHIPTLTFQFGPVSMCVLNLKVLQGRSRVKIPK